MLGDWEAALSEARRGVEAAAANPLLGCDRTQLEERDAAPRDEPGDRTVTDRKAAAFERANRAHAGPDPPTCGP